MEGNNDHEEERGNPLQTTNLGWPETLWPSLDEYIIFPDTRECCFLSMILKPQDLPEDHIKKFILTIRLMNVQHEDVVCRLFPYTFENSASTWYFNLPVGSITSWTKFQKDFLDKFAEETTTGSPDG
jgi:hypothetical protein